MVIYDDELDELALPEDDPKTIGEYLLERLDWDRLDQMPRHRLNIGLNNPGRWSAIRRIYELEQPAIGRGEYNPYLADWTSIFTPIERAMWEAIRCYGGLRFLPQYPVGRYFVDFGDPWSCIAIECDGKQWHDAERDAVRDRNLESMGWRVFRIPGSACFLRREGGRDFAFEMLENIYQRNGGKYPNYSEESEEDFG